AGEARRLEGQRQEVRRRGLEDQPHPLPALPRRGEERLDRRAVRSGEDGAPHRRAQRPEIVAVEAEEGAIGGGEVPPQGELLVRPAAGSRRPPPAPGAAAPPPGAGGPGPSPPPGQRGPRSRAPAARRNDPQDSLLCFRRCQADGEKTIKRCRLPPFPRA